jgi:predicted Zn-dependent peptidase
MEMYFGSHPLAARVLGTYDSVSQMTVKQMRDYHQLRYATGNMIVCATGNIDFDRLVEQVAECSADWSVGSRIRENFDVAIHPTAAVMQHPAACQNYWIRIGPGPSRRDNDRYAMRLLATILGDETGSRIFWELIDTGLAEGAALYCQEFDDVGVVYASLCAEPKDFESVQELLENVIHSGVTDPPRQEELEQAFRKIQASIVLASERSSNRLFTVGSAWLSRHVWETADEIIARYRAVTLSDLKRVAELYLKQPAISLLVCGEK